MIPATPTDLELAVSQAAALPVLDPRDVEQVSDLATEQKIVAAIVHQKGALDDIAAGLSPADFHVPANGTILKIAIELARTGSPIDESTVAAQLTRLRQLKRSGGLPWLHGFRDLVPTPESLPALIKVVADLSLARRVIGEARRIVADGLSSVEDPRAFVERAAETISGIIANDRSSCDVETSWDVATARMREWERQKTDGFKSNHLSSGFVRLDAITGGLRLGSVSLVCGLTGRGKSVYGSQVLSHVTGLTHNGSRVGAVHVSGEMDAQELLDRYLCAQAGVSERMIARVMAGAPQLPGEHPLHPHNVDQVHNAVTAAVNGFASNPIYFYAHIASVHDIRSALRNAQRDMRRNSQNKDNQPRAGLLVVDFVQLMKMNTRAERYDLALAEFAGQMKEVAAANNLHVMMLSQVPKSAKDRGGRFSAEDTKHGSGLSEAAHTVIFIHRPALDMEDGDEREKMKAYTEFQITKGRGHAVGTVAMKFDGERYRFIDPSPGEFDDVKARTRSPRGRSPTKYAARGGGGYPGEYTPRED